ncbi:MAG: gliding motility-associated C-terminal domain-containing protein [Flavobacteriia bacterium]|nr:gliding motility-associated C-terminal domain-containing protein [Flavobacteriia bacterium]
MKNNLLIVFSLLALFSFAQPANDNCAGAINLGSLPTPGACSAGLQNGAVTTVTGTTVAATSDSPFIYQTGCQGSSTNMNSPSVDVWYKFTATGTILNINLTGFPNANVALWTGTGGCGSLGGYACSIGSAGGTTNLVATQIQIGAVYYISIGGNTSTQTSTFTLNVDNDIDCNNCNQAASLTVSPMPVNGAYQPGQTVHFCYHIDKYAEANTNWMHGVQISLGAGWNQTSVVASPVTSYDCGTWTYYPSGIQDASSQQWPAGFYFNRTCSPLGGGTASDGIPGNNYGDHITANTSGNSNAYTIPANIWSFCFDVTVAAGCSPGSNLGVQINTSSDGESGPWGSAGCSGDYASSFSAIGACCAPTMASTSTCVGASTGTATATPVGSAGPYVYSWMPGNLSGQTVSGLAAGTYTVTVTDANLCAISNTVTVSSIAAPSAPTVTPVSYCQNAVASPLTATAAAGCTLNWYGTNSTGGTASSSAPTPSTTAVGTFTYYVSQTNSSLCEGPRVGITVTINPLATATISGSTTVCSGGSGVITFTGTPNATITYTLNGGANQTIVLNGAGTATVNSGAISSNAVYSLVSALLGTCTQGISGSATISVNTPPTATISGTISICSGNTAVLTLNGTANATVAYTVNGGASQTILLNSSGTATITTPVLTSNQTYLITSAYFAGSPGCSTSLNESELITVIPLPIASISGTTTICSGNTSVISFSGTANATVTYTIDGGANQTILLNASGTVTITTPVLTANSTYALVSVASSGSPTCTQPVSGSAIITVLPLPVASISGTTSICTGNSTVISFSGTANATITYTIDGGANQTILLNASGTATITTPVLTSNSTYTLVSVASSGAPSCTQIQTGSAIVTISNPPTATLSGSTTICSGSTATLTLNGTANATVSYTINGGATQTILLDGSGNATITTPSLTANQTYLLTSAYFASNPSCSSTLTDTETITVLPLPTATITGNATICSGTTSNVTFNGTANATVTYIINNGANQTVVLDGSGNAVVTSAVLTANATYSLVSVASSGIPSCSQIVIGSITIVVNPLPTVTITGNATICSGTTSNVTFNGTANATVTYTIDGGANQTVVLDGSGNATVTSATLTANSTYSLVSVASSGVPSCSQSQVGSVTIIVSNPPTATISGTTTICSGSTAVLTFNGTPNATVSYTVNGGATQTLLLNGAGNGSVTTSALTINQTYALTSAYFASTPACSTILNQNAIITVLALPTASISGIATICEGETTDITFTGTPNATVTYTINGGANQTIVLDGSGNAVLTSTTLLMNTTYSLVSVLSSGSPACSQVLTGSVLISIVPLPSASISGAATICSGTTSMVSFSGTPNSTVSYSVNGGVNQFLTLDGTGNGTLNTGILTSTTTYTLNGVVLNNSPYCAKILNQSISIIVEIPPVISFIPDVITGCAPLSVNFTNTTSNSYNCTWNFGDGATGSGCGTVNHVYQQAGCYDVTLNAESSNGCASFLVMPNLVCVEAVPLASFTPSPDIISLLNPTSTMINSSINAVTYSWNFGDGTSSTEINPSHTFVIGEEQNYTITLTAYSLSGCQNTAVAGIKVEEKLIYYIPNTFTPDDDKFNQTFQPIFSSGYDPYEFNMLIFNRWGEIVFESNNAKIGWDGTYGEKLVEDGTYTWKINFKLKSTDEKKLITGHVNILK